MVTIPLWIINFALQPFFNHVRKCCFCLSALSTRKVQSLLTLEISGIEFNLYFAMLHCTIQLTCYLGDWKLADSKLTDWRHFTGFVFTFK